VRAQGTKPSRDRKKRVQRYVAVAASLAVHVALFGMLAWVRAVPPRDYYIPPVDVSLLPPLDMGYTSAGSPGGGGGGGGAPGSALRRLDSPSAAAAQASAGLRGQNNPAPSQPAERAVRPPTPQTQALAAASAPQTPTDLRPVQSLAEAQPVETETPATLAARVQPLESPLAAANRRVPAPALRPAQTLAVDADRPAEALAQAARPQTAPAVTAASRVDAATGLRSAQALAVEADRPAESLAQAARPQAAPSATAAANRTAPAGALRPAQTFAFDADRPADTLAARASGPAAPPSIAAAGRPGAGAPQLRAAGGLAGPVGPQTPGPGQGQGQGPALAGGPGTTGRGQGVGGQAGGPGAGDHPGCAREILILLTPEERAKCNTPGNGSYDGLPSNADRDRAARMAAMRAVPYLSNVAPEKRAYYDAVAAAKQQVYEVPLGGKPPGLSCNLGALFGGKGGAPSERVKIPGLPCSFIPPQGVLTEEARIAPP
jgi:hypothetical protein